MKSPQDIESKRFITALESGDLAGVKDLPKSDLHIHSILGTRFESIESWLGKSLPRPASRMSSLNEMISYAHEKLYPHIMSREGFEFTATSAVEEAIEDGVTKLEMSLDMQFIAKYDTGPDGFLSFVSHLVESKKDRIDFRPEIGMSRDRSAETQARLASICIRSGLFHSIDLYGNEEAQPPESYRQLYADAKKQGLKLKAHVGEFAGPTLISETLDSLQLDEIQHGVRAAGSRPLMERLKRDRIRLNVCPSSNVVLGVVGDISQHPIRSLVDHGVRVTINSDDPTIFGRSVSQEYLLLFKAGVLSAAELEAIRLEGLAA
jgi:adenosine deaminase